MSPLMIDGVQGLDTGNEDPPSPLAREWASSRPEDALNLG